jgi:hypothetical protein
LKDSAATLQETLLQEEEAGSQFPSLVSGWAKTKNAPKNEGLDFIVKRRIIQIPHSQH